MSHDTELDATVPPQFHDMHQGRHAAGTVAPFSPYAGRPRTVDTTRAATWGFVIVCALAVAAGVILGVSQ